MGWIDKIIANIGAMAPEEIIWLSIGFLGQFLFAMRFIIQWIVSEKKRDSVIPIAFWYFSIGGGAIQCLDRNVGRGLGQRALSATRSSPINRSAAARASSSACTSSSAMNTRRPSKSRLSPTVGWSSPARPTTRASPRATSSMIAQRRG